MNEIANSRCAYKQSEITNVGWIRSAQKIADNTKHYAHWPPAVCYLAMGSQRGSYEGYLTEEFQLQEKKRRKEIVNVIRSSVLTSIITVPAR